MVTQELIEYISAQLMAGHDVDTVRSALVSGGWNSEDIEEGFRTVGAMPTEPPPVPVVQPETPKPTNEPAVVRVPVRHTPQEVEAAQEDWVKKHHQNADLFPKPVISPAPVQIPSAPAVSRGPGWGILVLFIIIALAGFFMLLKPETIAGMLRGGR